MATLARSPVMGGEWAGELAGGYGYSPGPSCSLVGGWAIPQSWFCRCSHLSPSHSSLVRVRWPLTWVAVLALRSRLAQVSTHERWGGLGAFEEGGCGSVHARGGHGGLRFGHVMVVLTPTSLERGGARWGRGGPG